MTEGSDMKPSCRKALCLWFFVLLSCSGCSHVADSTPPPSAATGSDAVSVNAVTASGSIRAVRYPVIFDVARGLAHQLVENMRDGSLSDRSCVVTTLADIDNLASSSRFGRVMAEALGAEIFRQGGRVKDVRNTRAIIMEPGQGEFGLSRDADETPRNVDAACVVVGTYGVGRHSVAITVRMIDTRTSGVLSVAMGEMARTEAVDSLLEASRMAAPTVYDRL